MFKEILVATGSDDHTREEAFAYISGHHGPLATSVPAIRDVLVAYAFNEVLAGDGVTAHRRDTDPLVVVEHICTSEADMKASTQDEGYITLVLADETYMTRTYMSGIPRAYCLEETVIFADDEPGAFRVIDFLARRDDIADADFFAALGAEAAALRDDPTRRAVIRQRVDNRVVAHEPIIVPFQNDCTAVVESWLDDPATLSDVSAGLGQSRAAFVDAQRSWSLLVRNRPLVARTLTAGT